MTSCLGLSQPPLLAATVVGLAATPLLLLRPLLFGLRKILSDEIIGYLIEIDIKFT